MVRSAHDSKTIIIMRLLSMRGVELKRQCNSSQAAVDADKAAPVPCVVWLATPEVLRSARSEDYNSTQADVCDLMKLSENLTANVCGAQRRRC